MLVINSIEKTRLSADSYSYSGTGVAWKARLVLFFGFALMAGGLAGSVVCSSRVQLGVCRRMLMKLRTGCTGTEIHRPGLPFPNAVFWCCQCHCKRFDYAEVCIQSYAARRYADGSLALWYSGFRKIWRTTIPTT